MFTNLLKRYFYCENGEGPLNCMITISSDQPATPKFPRRMNSAIPQGAGYFSIFDENNLKSQFKEQIAA